MGDENELRRQSADALAREGNFEAAIAFYREVVKANPRDESALLSLAWLYKDSGNLEEAIKCFEELLARELSRQVFTAFAFDELVRIYRQEKRFRRLIEICERAVQVQPDDVSLLTTLGEAYLRAGDPQRAIAAFKEIIGLEPDSLASFLRLGNAYIAAGKFELAQEAYARAISLDPPGQANYRNRLGHAYLAAGQCERAEMAFREAIIDRPAESLYYCDLGDALIRQGRLSEAGDAYGQAVKNDPRSESSFYNRLGNSLARNGNHAEAVEVFEKAISVDPKNRFYYLHLADSYKALNLTGKAEETLERVRRIR